MLPSVALLTALAALSSPDAEDGALARARLVVSAPALCLTHDDLARRVRARAPTVTFADDAAILARVAVTAYSPTSQVVAVDVTRRGERQHPRMLRTRTCGEAADAVALILAVTLDPTSQASPAANTGSDESSSHIGGDSAPPGLTGSSTPGASHTSAPGRGTRPLATEARAPAAPPVPQLISKPPKLAPASPPATPSTTARPGTGVRLSIAAAADALFGASPRLMPGFSLSAALEGATDAAWSPALSLRWTHVWTSGVAEPSGAASFTLDAGTLDACPLRWRWSQLAVRPCASVLVGRMATHGSGTTDDAGADRPFSAAGLALQVRLGQTVEVAARVGVGVALIRDTYAFGDQVFYRTGFLTTSASLGLGAHWP